MNQSAAGAKIGRELRWISEAHDQAKQARIEAAEQIRTALQQRSAGGSAVEFALLLAAVSRGESQEPSPELAAAYQRSREEEAELARLLEERLRDHPAWEWLHRVRGVDAGMAGKLLSRLDAVKAGTPSSFWSYCGLATVPGVEYRCAGCGFVGAFAAGQAPPARHFIPDGGELCSERLRPGAGPEAGVRAAQPRRVAEGRGGRPSYDPVAREVCFQIGTALLRAGGAYSRYYRQERLRLEDTRPTWPEGRRHLTALRKMEKLFLAQLWLVWREALGLPLTEPHADVQHGPERQPDPWEMVGLPRRRWTRSEPVAPSLRPRLEM